MDETQNLASTGLLVNNEMYDSDSSSSLFKTQCDSTRPTGKSRNISTSNTIESPVNTQLRDYSSNSSSELEPFNLRVIFENWKKKKRRKYKPTGRPRGRPKGSFKKQPLAISKKNLFKDKGLQFPLIESENGRKPLLWKKILGYEQAVARGFFNYVKEQKYESHLKEALKHLDVGEDLEKEDFGVRKHKYLDDDGSISPIEEPDLEESHLDDPDECDVKLVESSCFIISTEFPENIKTKKSLKSRNDTQENNCKKDETDLPRKKKNSGQRKKKGNLH
ncbi:TATA box-binding protein-associated factor RNA polymerase I subunit D [Dromiciops gliroides]|uniref:TATA box-binding protein-associated factor RNA polymerase I subunit D n=1 Tax=Dromiciops gliroides TaxID=33562 RepID=UPI001CC6D5AC|nr:TATA box-binding protein-associated factor RNA polymerase I subunit D [Dromiciops gliroides]XP_043846945.1 TATA box-binding protein-associated factor RNA polymerase I subunit D [Dromiciops gliroides]XP_043846946.1 TATA box-binding protein-associated factor RNA polymerase I subunit D [Dromiciops gliroides]